MKVLVMGEFDPCAFMQRFREPLAAIGVELKIAVRDVWRPEWCEVDWVLGSSLGLRITHGRIDELRDYARKADVLVVCPAIGQDQGWSYQHGAVPRFDLEPDRWFPIDWDAVPEHRVALFHGSRALAGAAEAYAEHYRGKGYAIAATTLDYRHRMGALYWPPVVDLKGYDRAPARGDGAPLKVIQTPTSPEQNQTEQLLKVCAACGIGPTVRNGLPHHKCLRLKAEHHVGFDHMRGSYSINSIENAGLGLVNIVGLEPDYRGWLHANGWAPPDWPMVWGWGDVHSTLCVLRDSPQLTREWQERGRKWFDANWQPPQIAGWVKEHVLGA